ncbi:TetR family transcriptional regulator [Parageobacillus thermoglucosidasius]|uniref:TetR/AcrR family transcriptional regulator C-terminal domain-containing protein n=1 Tax=Parageobacillus thermoglucosidasius TaxID=1426 RepID=A0AB38QTN9_PARTM|nr:TetR family transcriptional regulator [Parageobacillus thermoglucosidasius]UOE74854.1 TetR/AcrR family transcriptional regulator C-terminal domain-containing protein [Parageobacillus thermoglucosidasius]
MALRKEQIIEEALQLLNESGLEGVTLRKLAKRLGVQAPALYWHFNNKAALVNEMAEAILQTEFADLQPRGDGEPWQDWLIRTLNRLRKAMLSYTDGGRVVAGAHLSLTMAKISEVAIQSLHSAGISLREARLIVLAATHYTFGYVIEEQTTLPSPEEIKDFDFEQFKKEHPLMVQSIEEYFASGRTVDDLFNDGLKMIVGVYIQHKNPCQ